MIETKTVSEKNEKKLSKLKPCDIKKKIPVRSEVLKYWQ